MKKALILIAAAVVGLSGGLYFALSDRESPATVRASVDYSALAALREGDMAKLQFNADRGSDVVFKSGEGEDMTFADYRGKITLVNFWATWCAPCRVELGGEEFEVVTIATGRNPRPAMEQFFREIEVDNLPLHTDANSTLARDMGVLGLPVTLILDRDGNEIARLMGDADWASDSAKAIIAALIDR